VELVETSARPRRHGDVRQRLPKDAARPEWSALHTEFVVTISDKLTIELIATNESADKRLEIENCLHTYFHVGDIKRVSITGLQARRFDDFAAGAAGARKVENDAVLRITKETNRVYPDATGTVEIRDENLKRTIRVEKFNSKSTVVWNPWTTQEIAGRLRPGGTQAHGLRGIRQLKAEQNFASARQNNEFEGGSEQPAALTK